MHCAWEQSKAETETKTALGRPLHGGNGSPGLRTPRWSIDCNYTIRMWSQSDRSIYSCSAIDTVYSHRNRRKPMHSHTLTHTKEQLKDFAIIIICYIVFLYASFFFVPRPPLSFIFYFSNQHILMAIWLNSFSISRFRFILSLCHRGLFSRCTLSRVFDR